MTIYFSATVLIMRVSVEGSADRNLPAAGHTKERAMTPESTKSENPVQDATPEAKKAARKSASKKAPAKGTKKAPVKKAPVRVTADAPAGERRVNVVKALRRAGAVSQTQAVPMADLAEKVGYSAYDVYGCVCGHSGKTGSAPTCLVATKHAAVCKHEGVRGLSVYLTKAGQRTKFDEAPFVAGQAD